MGIVEELGSGIKRMFKYTPLYANGKEPIIEEQDVFRIVIPYIPIQSENNTESGLKTTEKTENHTENHGGLSRIQREILKKLKENPAYSRRELANVIENASLGGVISALSRLQELGIIRRVGPDKGGHWEIVGLLQD